MATAVVVASVASACAGHSKSASPTSTRRPPRSTTAPPTTAPDPKTAVLAAYQEFWQVWLKANNPPDPNYPDLERVATGTELATVKASIAKSEADGTYTRLPARSHYRHEPQLIAHLGEKITVSDCSVDDSQIVTASTGAIVNDDVVTQLLLIELTPEGTGWKVDSVRQQRQWSGIQPCDS